jgi:integration host factor subunit beta
VAETKATLIAAVAARSMLAHAQAESVVRQVFECMSDALRRGEGIEIRNFGSFSVRSYGAYKGRNPRDGQAIHVKAKRLPFFRVGKTLRIRVNVVAHASAAPK